MGRGIFICGSIANMGRARHSIIDKRGAVTAFLITGSFKKASEATGIDRRTIGVWAKSDWWLGLEDEITELLGKRLTAKMRGVAIKAYEQLDDRLENGDIQAYRDDHFRLPINAKDLSLIGNVASDKVRLGEGKATRISQSTDLQTMALQFEAIADKYIEKIGAQMTGTRPIIDGEVVRVALPGDRS